MLNESGDLIAQAKAGSKSAVVQLALGYFNAQNFEQADYWLDRAVSLRIEELYPLRIKLWFSDKIRRILWQIQI